MARVRPTPQVSFSPAWLTFGNQNVGTTTPMQTITLANGGNAALSISSLSIGGANASDFSETNNCANSLGIGAICTIAATFRPSLAANESAFISVIDNASGSPQNIPLSGTGSGSNGGGGLAINPPFPVAQEGMPLSFSANSSVTWSLVSGSSGSIGSGGIYTAPPTIAPNQQLGGCQLMGNDHVFNTRVDGLPVHAKSGAWMGTIPSVRVSYLPSWGENVITSSTPITVNAEVFAYTPANNGWFELPQWPYLHRENGVFSSPLDGEDRHTVTIDQNTCQVYEIYNEYPAGTMAERTGANRAKRISVQQHDVCAAGGAGSDGRGEPAVGSADVAAFGNQSGSHQARAAVHVDE